MSFRHGTRTGYTYHHCPCERCKAAHAAYNRAYKEGVRLRIDPAPARDHINALRVEGWTLTALARRSGYHVQTIRNIALGKTAYADAVTVEDILSIPRAVAA